MTGLSKNVALVAAGILVTFCGWWLVTLVKGSPTTAPVLPATVDLTSIVQSLAELRDEVRSLGTARRVAEPVQQPSGERSAVVEDKSALILERLEAMETQLHALTRFKGETQRMHAMDFDIHRAPSRATTNATIRATTIDGSPDEKRLSKSLRLWTMKGRGHALRCTGRRSAPA